MLQLPAHGLGSTELQVLPTYGTAAERHLWCSPQNYREVEVGRDLWGSSGPTPCLSRATQSHLPSLPGPQIVPHSTDITNPITLQANQALSLSAHPSTHSAACSHHHPSLPISSILKTQLKEAAAVGNWKCRLQRMHKAGLEPQLHSVIEWR